MKFLSSNRASYWFAPVLIAAAFSLSLVLGGEGRGEGPGVGTLGLHDASRRVRSADRYPVSSATAVHSADPTSTSDIYVARRAQTYARPLTLTLSPEYEGEGTGAARLQTACEAPGAAPSPASAPSSQGLATRPIGPATRLGRELNLLAMGDWGEAKSAQKTVADAMADYVVAQKAPFAGLLSAGDNFYGPLASVDDPTWQTMFEKMYDATRLDFPFYGALGNHDYDQNKYLVELAYAKQHPESRWKLPGRWYRIDLPAKEPLATVIILDSDKQVLTPVEWVLQKTFLAEELARPRAAWTICVAHHPLFSNGVAADNGLLQRDW
ncbi:MAG: putative phosphohydrolase, partial [Phycisphaerales bacterium]|nr:putative phosphohydrolase [Phycisphaerales bacterium]